MRVARARSMVVEAERHMRDHGKDNQPCTGPPAAAREKPHAHQIRCARAQRQEGGCWRARLVAQARLRARRGAHSARMRAQRARPCAHSTNATRGRRARAGVAAKVCSVPPILPCSMLQACLELEGRRGNRGIGGGR